jgi:hypothetical protein
VDVKELGILEVFFDDPDFLPQYNHGRFLDIVQPLEDLGYLTISDVPGEIVRQGELRKAVCQFRDDVKMSGLFENLGTWNKLPYAVTDDTLTNLVSSSELKILHHITSLDGEFHVDMLQLCLGPLELNNNISYQNSLFMRVVKFRLGLLGQNTVTKKNNTSIIESVLALSNLLHLKKMDKMMDLLGNFSHLAEYIKESDDFAKKEAFIIYDIKKDANHLKALIKMSRTNAKIPSKKKKKKLVENLDNQFLTRLMQIRLWQFGFYPGKIDALFQGLSLTALYEMLDFDTTVGNKTKKTELESFIKHQFQDLWSIDLKSFFDLVEVKSEKREIEVDEILSEYNRYEEGLAEGEHSVLENSLMNNMWKEANKEQNNILKQNRGLFFRKVYFGTRSIIRRIWAGIKNLFKKITEFARKFIQQIKSLSRLLFREIREGMNAFGRGLAFLFGLRSIVTSSKNASINTIFDFDCDASLYVQGSFSNDIIEKHMYCLKQIADDLEFTLPLTGKIISWIIAVSTCHPRVLAVKIGEVFQSLFKLKFKEKIPML